MGDPLANKLEEGGKKIAESSTSRASCACFAAGGGAGRPSRSLTGLDTPVAGVLEQSMFYVNQIMQFGKLLAVLQPHPSDPGKTVVTAFMALGVKTDVLERKKEFERVPVLRNLVPAQVLDGQQLVQHRHLDQRRPAEIRPQPHPGDRRDFGAGVSGGRRASSEFICRT